MELIISSSSMASLFLTSPSPLWAFTNNPTFRVSITKHPYTKCPNSLFPHRSKLDSRRKLNFSAKDEEHDGPSSSNSSVRVSPEETNKVESSSEVIHGQELDFKTDEEQGFMGNPPFEEEVKLGKERTDGKLKNEVDDPSDEELDRENGEEFTGNPSIEEEIIIHTKRAAQKLLEFDIAGFIDESSTGLNKMRERSEKEVEELKATRELLKVKFEELEMLKNKMDEAYVEFLKSEFDEESEVEKLMDEVFNDPYMELDLEIGEGSLVDTVIKVIRQMNNLSNMYNMKRVKRKIEFEKKLLRELKNDLEHKTGATPAVDRWFKAEYEILEKKLDSLKKSVEAFKTLDLRRIKSCFGNDTFFVTDVGRFGDEGILVGKLMKPIEEVIPELEKKVSEAVGEEMVLSFAEEESNDITSQVCMVRTKTRMDHEYEPKELSLPWALVLCASGFWILSSMGGFFVKPDATFGYYLANIVPLFGGLLSVWGVSMIATRITAASYGVKLGIPFLDSPNFLSQLPNKKALFDISFAQIASAYVSSFLLTVAASMNDASLTGSALALYLRPQFFDNNPLLSLIPFVLGVRSNDSWYSLPYALEELQVPVNPLALAGLLGIVMTSLRLLPVGRFEGSRIARALFGKYVAELLTLGTILLITLGALRGSVVCLALFIYDRISYEKEMPAKDEITRLGDDRLGWGFLLAVICFLTLFPNSNFSLFSLPFSSGTL